MHWIERILVGLIFVSITCLLIEVDVQHTQSDQHSVGALALAEWLIAAAFTLEIGARAWLASQRSADDAVDVRGYTHGTMMHALHSRRHVPHSINSYVRSPEFIIDVICVAPFWVSVVCPPAWFGLLRSLRVLRLLKLYRYSTIAHDLARVFMSKLAGLRVLVTVVFITVMLGAVAVYDVEHAAQPEAFGDIGDAIWWMVVTMTTVGYGDISPVTTGGKVIAMMLMPISLGIMGALIGIVGGVFDAALEDTDDQ
jgi:hypothetical protein